MFVPIIAGLEGVVFRVVRLRQNEYRNGRCLGKKKAPEIDVVMRANISYVRVRELCVRQWKRRALPLCLLHFGNPPISSVSNMLLEKEESAMR